MDFFEHQDLARRNTRRLVLLMGLAVLAIIALTTLLFVIASVSLDTGNGPPGRFHWRDLYERLGWQPLVWISLLVSAMVLAGSLFKWLQLRSGGQAVAEALGGQRIPGNTNEPAQRQLLNVVEEMAIASGTPVPAVYQLDEPGINAFAAGHGPHDAVIGVTRGTVATLSRDELQGVIAHEFSHILHGDMRLNLRLVAVLNGLLLIGLLGYMLLRGGARRSLSRNRRQGNVALVGLGLIVLGAVGTFFGNWIKAAVSRQREFLADASAVQYTRHPAGIGGALLKIGAHPGGARLDASDADEFSHMYFEEGVTVRLSGLMATHPPLEDRIRRVLPNWDGRFPTPETGAEDERSQAPEASQPDTGTGPIPTAAITGALAAAAEAEPIARARHLLDTLPEGLRAAAQDPFTARGLVFGLALDRNAGEHRDRQLDLLRQTLSQRDYRALLDPAERAAGLPEEARLPLLELSLSTLTQLSDTQKQAFLHTLNTLTQADQRLQLGEWILYRLARTHLEQAPAPRQRLKLDYCRDEGRLLLSLACRADREDPQAAYHAGATDLNESRPPLELADIRLSELDRALDRLRQLRPLEKPRLLRALRQCLWADRQVTPREAELYRAIADALDCPTPPLPPTGTPDNPA